MRAAEAAVSAVRRAGLTPDVVMLTALMRAHLENGNVPEAWRQWTLLERHGMVPDAAAYATAIAACGAGGELERAENIFEQYQQTGLPPNRRVYHELIHACGRRKDYYGRAFALVDEMAAAGIAADRRTYRLLLDCAARRRDTLTAEDVWRKMETEFGPPDGLQSYTTLLSAYAGGVAMLSRSRAAGLARRVVSTLARRDPAVPREGSDALHYER